jgi:hypothetical protein
MYDALRNVHNYNIDEIMKTLAEDLLVISYQLVVGVYATLSVMFFAYDLPESITSIHILGLRHQRILVSSH